MGQDAISFQEIEAYARLTDADISPDEVVLIRHMSTEFVRWMSDKDPSKKPPIMD